MTRHALYFGTKVRVRHTSVEGIVTSVVAIEDGHYIVGETWDLATGIEDACMGVVQVFTPEGTYVHAFEHDIEFIDDRPDYLQAAIPGHTICLLLNDLNAEVTRDWSHLPIRYLQSLHAESQVKFFTRWQMCHTCRREDILACKLALVSIDVCLHCGALRYLSPQKYRSVPESIDLSLVLWGFGMLPADRFSFFRAVLDHRDRDRCTDVHGKHNPHARHFW